jgi:hypothetical protein
MIVKKEKLINYFAAANIADSVLTWIALEKLNFQEANTFANEIIQSDGFEKIILIKFAVISLLILLYAISQDNESKFSYSTEKAVQISNAIVWFVVISNLLQIALEIT